ncbi:hypothetical protein U9608_002602 [Vibrio alginolyticus]|uniref:hypothetical protein n=1 Tax=Vibrio TaxID=662 RepID=UPI00102DDEC3|nr:MULTISPECIES: hypothetical protein [Vibrio]EMB9235068.1 hypothetical protein [Vibrio alginolyticus]MCF7509468.1 hypothetical protein [Vibrio sp. D54]RZV20173.1 hypothetical protein EOJ41_08575 [Vibrio alginolyticus]
MKKSLALAILASLSTFNAQAGVIDFLCDTYGGQVYSEGVKHITVSTYSSEEGKKHKIMLTNNNQVFAPDEDVLNNLKDAFYNGKRLDICLDGNEAIIVEASSN